MQMMNLTTCKIYAFSLQGISDTLSICCTFHLKWFYIQGRIDQCVFVDSGATFLSQVRRSPNKIHLHKQVAYKRPLIQHVFKCMVLPSLFPEIGRFQFVFFKKLLQVCSVFSCRLCRLAYITNKVNKILAIQAKLLILTLTVDSTFGVYYRYTIC